MQREKEETMKRELAAKQEREKQLAREQEEVGSLWSFMSYERCLPFISDGSGWKKHPRKLVDGN